MNQKTKYTNTNNNLREMMCLWARGKHDGDNGKAILTLVKWLTGVEWCRGEHPPSPPLPYKTLNPMFAERGRTPYLQELK